MPPTDVKNMSLPSTSARSQRKGFGWNQSRQCLRRQTNGSWTDKHRNVMRKFVVEGGWAQNMLHDIGWSDDKKRQGCGNEEGTKKRRLYHCLPCREVINQILEAVGNGNRGQKTANERWAWRCGISWNRRSESEKHMSWCMPVEGFS